MKKSYQTKLILLFLLTILTLYLLNSNIVISSILEYTELFIKKLFPTSFIIYIVSSLLINYQIIEFISKLSKNPGILYVTLMSIICGFPSGAKNIKELSEKNYISKDTCNYLLKFTHFPNPLFILGSISQLLNINITLKIYLSLLLSNFIIALVAYKKTTSNSIPHPTQLNFSSALSNAITSSFKLQLLIYGTNLFFHLIAVIINNYIKTEPLIFVIINGIFDLIKGIYSVSLISSEIIKCVLIITFISFGSISIHIQIKSIITDANLNYKVFLQGRLFATTIAIISFLIIYKF